MKVNDVAHGWPLHHAGDVGVDDALIKLQSATQIIEMLNGCVCCTGARSAALRLCRCRSATS
jgi:G3E family GTPase